MSVDGRSSFPQAELFCLCMRPYGYYRQEIALQAPLTGPITGQGILPFGGTLSHILHGQKGRVPGDCKVGGLL